MGGFFFVLTRAGWHAGDAVGAGSPLHHAYLPSHDHDVPRDRHVPDRYRVAARTERASLREVGVTSNPLLLWGIAFELAFAAAVATLPRIANRVRHEPPPLAVLPMLLDLPDHRVGRRRDPPRRDPPP